MILGWVTSPFSITFVHFIYPHCSFNKCYLKSHCDACLPIVSQLRFHPSLFSFVSQQAESLQTTFLDSLISWLFVRFCQWEELVGVWKTKGGKKPTPSQSQLQGMPPTVASSREDKFCLGNAFLTAEAAVPPERSGQAYAPESPSSDVVQFQ